MKIMDTYLITYINNIIYTYYKCLDFIKIIKNIYEAHHVPVLMVNYHITILNFLV